MGRDGAGDENRRPSEADEQSPTPRLLVARSARQRSLRSFHLLVPTASDMPGCTARDACRDDSERRWNDRRRGRAGGAGWGLLRKPRAARRLLTAQRQRRGQLASALRPRPSSPKYWCMGPVPQREAGANPFSPAMGPPGAVPGPLSPLTWPPTASHPLCMPFRACSPAE